MIEKGIRRRYATLFSNMQKLPVNDFKWAEDISELDEDFIESYNDESDGEHLKLMFNNLKAYLIFTMIYPFCLKISKLKKLKNLR